MGLRNNILILLMLAVSLVAHAQSPIKIRVREPVPADSADIEYYENKNFAQAALTVAGLNVGVWAFDRYVRDTEFSHISLETVKENFKTGFKWDNDHIGTNMFMHPYHGNLYFSSARVNGFNFWQSSLFAFAGSAMWEMCMENEYPSTNDIICTPIGGTAFGEVTYRASDMLLKDNSRGWERFGHEAAVFLISPMRGLTRIINGDAWRYRSTPGRQFGTPNLAIEVSAGVRMLGFKNQVADEGFGMITELNMEYGDRFDLRSKAPYDYFSVTLNLSAQKSQPVLSQANITGRLISREVIDTKHQDMSVGLYQHYDFFDSDTLSPHTNKTPYKLGIPASVGAGLMYRYKERGHFAFDAYTHVNGVILGGVLSDHYEVRDRNYNLASGLSVKSGANLVLNRDMLSLSASYQYYRLFTWGYPRETDLAQADYRTLNAEGDASVAYFGVANVRIDLRLARRLYLTGDMTHYKRSTRYRDFPRVTSGTFALRLMLTYKI